jgi:putative transposase
LEEKLVMPIKKYKPEQIVTMLRQIEVSIANGKITPQACKEAAITVQTYYRWRKEYGGLKLEQAKRLKDLEKENSRLKRLVAELSLVHAVPRQPFSAWNPCRTGKNTGAERKFRLRMTGLTRFTCCV